MDCLLQVFSANLLNIFKNFGYNIANDEVVGEV